MKCKECKVYRRGGHTHFAVTSLTDSANTTTGLKLIGEHTMKIDTYDKIVGAVTVNYYHTAIYSSF